MAQTYTISTYSQLGSNKTMLAIFNGAGSGRVIRVYKVWTIHNPLLAVTSTLTVLNLERLSNVTGGNSLTSSVDRHDTTSESISSISQITITDSSTITASSTIRQIVWSANTPASIGAQNTIGELQSIYSLMRVFEAGYYNANLEPLVLREGEGIGIRQPGANTNGFIESIIEFTMSNS